MVPDSPASALPASAAPTELRAALAGLRDTGAPAHEAGGGTLVGLASAILISQRQLLRQFHGDDTHAAVWEGPADEHDSEDRGSRDS